MRYGGSGAEATDARMMTDAGRFLVAGTCNALLSLAVYQAALFVARPAISYFTAWIAGIAFLVIVYPNKVFPGGRQGTKDRFYLAISYIGVFFLGLFFLEALVKLSAAPRLAILGTLVLTTAINFVLSRLILRRRR
jgi:putative flippase GtrA